MKSRREGARGPFVLLLSFSAVLPSVALSEFGCNDSATPSGKGNTVVNDTRDAQPRPPPNPNPDDGGEVTGEPDATFYDAGGGGGGSYPGLSACSDCACDLPQGYCFGGAPARARGITPEAKDAAADAGLPACAIASGATPSVGCNAPPSGCTDCACVLATLQPSIACYLVCANAGGQITVYCPNP
jgi:hypothetical protein